MVTLAASSLLVDLSGSYAHGFWILGVVCAYQALRLLSR